MILETQHQIRLFDVCFQRLVNFHCPLYHIIIQNYRSGPMAEWPIDRLEIVSNVGNIGIYDQRLLPFHDQTMLNVAVVRIQTTSSM